MKLKSALSRLSTLCILALSGMLWSSCTRTTGSIQVNSTPTGAMVWLDQDSTGRTTNCRFDNVEPGVHGLTLRLAGYNEYTTYTTVTVGQTAVVDCPLAQPKRRWIVDFGDPGSHQSGWSVWPTADGGYVVAGVASPSSWRDIGVFKFDEFGNCLWMKAYGGTDEDYGRAMVPNPDGGFAICGFTWHQGDSGDARLIRTDANGDTLWTRRVGRGVKDVAHGISRTSDGGYVLTGAIWTSDSAMYDLFLIRTDADGDTLWTRAYGGQYFDVGYGVVETPDGGFAVGGYTDSYGGGYRNFWLIQTDSNGDTLWTRTYGGEDKEVACSIQQTFDGGYVICGYTGSFGSYVSSAWLVKTDASGDTLWTRAYNYDIKPCDGYYARQTPDSGYIITGMSTDEDYDRNLLLIKTDARGYATP